MLFLKDKIRVCFFNVIFEKSDLIAIILIPSLCLIVLLQYVPSDVLVGSLPSIFANFKERVSYLHCFVMSASTTSPSGKVTVMSKLCIYIYIYIYILLSREG